MIGRELNKRYPHYRGAAQLFFTIILQIKFAINLTVLKRPFLVRYYFTGRTKRNLCNNYSINNCYSRLVWHMTNLFTATSIHSIEKNTRTSENFRNKLDQKMTEDSRIKRERNRVDKQKCLTKQKRKGVQKKKLIDAPCERKIKVVVGKYVSSKIIFFPLYLLWTNVFLAKNVILISLTAIFPEKVCFNFSYKNLY